MTSLGLGVLVFVVVQLAIGWWVSRRMRGEADYLVAGRRLGWWMAGFSLFATWFGAESILGASAAIAEEGLAGGRADPLGYAIVLIVLGVFLAIPMRRTEALTLPQMFSMRFGSVVGRVAAVLVIPASLIWGGAQIRALGQIVSMHAPIDMQTAIIGATLCVIVYTWLGGLLGDVITDVVQGAILLGGVVTLAVVLVLDAGGPAAAWASIEPEQWRLVGGSESLWTRIDTFAVPVVGALIVQETASRMFACRTPRIARKAAVFGGVLYLLFGSVPVAIGLLGAHVPLELGGSEEFVPALAEKVLHPAAYVAFAGAMVSVILSSVDSALLAVGAIVSHDVLPMFTRDPGDAGRLRLARLAVVLAGAGAGAIALASDSIYELVLFGDSLGTGGVAVVGVMAVFSSFGGRWAAASTLVAAWVASILFEYVIPGVGTPFLASLACAALVYAAVGAFERPGVPLRVSAPDGASPPEACPPCGG